jgi:hypothetical protein
VGSSVAADWCRQASIHICAGGQKDAVAGSSVGQKDAAVGSRERAKRMHRRATAWET